MKYLIARLRNGYVYNIKLRNKLLLSHLLLIILPTIVLSFFLYSNLYDIIVSDTILSEQALTSQTTTTIEATLSRVTQASDSLVQSDAVSRVFSESALTLHSTALNSRILGLQQQAESLTDDELITGIRFYMDDSCRSILEAGNIGDSLMASLSSVSSTYWYGIISSTGADSLFCPTLYLSVTEAETLGELAYIQKVENDMDAEIYLVIYFSEDILSSVLSANITTQSSATYILNERDTIVASSSSVLSGAYYMSNSELTSLVGSVNLYTTSVYRDESIYVGYYTIENTNWHLVSILSANSLVAKGNTIVMQFIGIYLLFFVLALFIAVKLSGSIANRIATLVHQMQNVHNQRPVRIESKYESHDEIGDLLNTYNYMSDEINELMDQQERTSEELRLEEFNALQAQINPHFLYNSLDMISWLSQSGKTDEAAQAVRTLSKFYKLTLSKKDSINTIANELEHVSLYTQLQNMRYEDRITLIIDVPEFMLGYNLPKLTLQPIVENSILHGIMEKEDKTGTILITGWTEDEDVILLVSDDGIGMSPEQIASMLTGTHQDIRKGTGIGIYNTHSRLQLLYGASYGLHYESTPGCGTEVTIRIPASYGNSEKQ